MKCINKLMKGLALLLAAAVLSGCSAESLVKEYQSGKSSSPWNTETNQVKSTGLASELCVVNTDIIPEDVGNLASGAAGLFDITNKNVLYASKIHERMYPASITKLMTILLLLENYQGDFTEIVTASSQVAIMESGASLCGYKAGDQVSLDQLIHGLLICSGNDAAVMIAEYVSGSVEGFVNLMNQRAMQLGATNTHFVNPHGLHDEQHYTTAYDQYLIFQQVMKYEKFREVISKKDYEGEYIQASGRAKAVKWNSTNLFLTGDKEIPEGVLIIGGKTGTTKSAGACLILLSQDAQGVNYISIVLKASDKDTLYADMAKLLGKIGK